MEPRTTALGRGRPEEMPSAERANDWRIELRSWMGMRERFVKLSTGHMEARLSPSSTYCRKNLIRSSGMYLEG